MTVSSGPSRVGSDAFPIGTIVPLGRWSVMSMIAESAEPFPWFMMVMDKIAIWPSIGSAGIVDADWGVRSGVPSGGAPGCTSIRTDALASFPRASSTVTLARRDTLPLPRPTARDVSTQAKWFPERRFSDEIGIRIDTSVTYRCRETRFGDAAMDEVDGTRVVRNERVASVDDDGNQPLSF